jgi:hypothetical protein
MDWSFGLKRNLLLGAVAAVVLLPAAGAWGQTGTTAINGDVTDPQARALVGPR